jgi:hypothetical protein
MKTRRWLLPVVALSILLAADDASAQKSLRNERISLAFRDTPATTVVRTLAKSLGYDIELDEKLNAPVSIELNGVSPTTALNAMCESVGCTWKVAGKTLRVEKTQVVVMENQSLKVRSKVLKTPPKALKTPPNAVKTRPLKAGVLGGTVGGARSIMSVDEQMPMKISWVAADADVVFHLFALMLVAREEVAPVVGEQRVSMQVEPGTLRQALDAVCAKVACRWEVVEKPRLLNGVPVAPERVLRITGR